MDPLKILIVDDEEELVDALTERLNLRGFETTGVTTGANALELIHAESFDVLLVDVKMPGMGGMEVIREVKSFRPDLQIVLLTGHGAVETAEEGMRLGASEFLLKPVNINELIATLTRAVTKGDHAEK